MDTTNIIMASWRANTQDKYGTYINQWLSFCESKGINYLLATTNDGLCFLTEVFNKGRQYHTVAAARSALSAILPLEHGLPFGERPLVSKFVKGVANIRPPLPKYTSVWSVDKLFDCFRGMDDNDRLSLKELTYKVTSLLCLVLCQRAQTIHSFHTTCIKITKEGAHIDFPTVLKTTRPGRHLKPIFIPIYPSDIKICPVNALEMYLDKTKVIRGTEEKLLISLVKPHKAVTSKTVSRWLKMMLLNAGIDISIFQGHSLRAAGSSQAKLSGVPITNILQIAGWATAKTFAVHYDKPIIEKDITQAILST